MAEPMVILSNQRLLRPELGGAGQGIPREPSLDDLLNDPIMLLVWRGAGLEPSQARAAIRNLFLSLRRRRSAGRSLIEVMRPRLRENSALAA